MTTAAAATTRAMGRRRWWPRAETWTRWPPRWGGLPPMTPCARGWPPPGARTSGRSSGIGRWIASRRGWSRPRLLVEPDGQDLDLVLELRQPEQKLLALLAEC